MRGLGGEEGEEKEEEDREKREEEEVEKEEVEEKEGEGEDLDGVFVLCSGEMEKLWNNIGTYMCN